MAEEKQISVIILAHRRRKYLDRALNSVLQQTLDKRFYEIIVVKNFTDPVFDEKAAAVGTIVINSSLENLGGKMVEGIQSSSGRLISFLEDDDEFLPGKLETSLKEFQKSSELIYFHNSAMAIENGSEIKNKTVMAPPIMITVQGQVIPKVFRTLSNTGSFGNNSCLTLRRSFLEKYLVYIEKLNVTVDGFLFLAALDMEKELKFDVRPFTRYYLDTGFTLKRYTNASDYVANKLTKSEVMLQDKENFDEIVMSYFRNSLLQRFSSYSLMKERLNCNLYGKKASTISLRDLFKYTLDSVYFWRVKSILGLPIHFIALKSPKVAARIAYYIES